MEPFLVYQPSFGPPHTRGDDNAAMVVLERVARSTPTRVGTTEATGIREGTEDGPPPHAWGRRVVV